MKHPTDHHSDTPAKSGQNMGERRQLFRSVAFFLQIGWSVVVPIVVGGGLFGFVGMLFGVPTFAVIYYLIQRTIAYLLGRKGLPSKSLDYTVVTHVDPETKELCTGDWVRNEPFHFGLKKKKKTKRK